MIRVIFYYSFRSSAPRYCPLQTILLPSLENKCRLSSFDTYLHIFTTTLRDRCVIKVLKCSRKFRRTAWRGVRAPSNMCNTGLTSPAARMSIIIVIFCLCMSSSTFSSFDASLWMIQLVRYMSKVPLSGMLPIWSKFQIRLSSSPCLVTNASSAANCAA